MSFIHKEHATSKLCDWETKIIFGIFWEFSHIVVRNIFKYKYLKVTEILINIVPDI